MALVDEIKNIGKWKKYPSDTNLPKLTSGNSDTIEDFWETIVKPYLLKEKVVKAWLEVLYEYIEREDAVYAIRKFEDKLNNTPKNLRRGWYNKVKNVNWSFFYTDNYFASYFAKMALNEYVPEEREFYEMMINHTFPARYSMGDYDEELQNATFKINARNPGIGTRGYKIAHIVNTGENYSYNGKCYGITEICNKYFPRGKYEYWNISVSADKEYPKYRELPEDSKEGQNLLKAHFLRFACPLNYFFTPLKTKLVLGQVDIYKNDIAEHDPLLKYVMIQFYKIYKDTYAEYLEKVLYYAPGTAKIKLEDLAKKERKLAKEKIDIGWSIEKKEEKDESKSTPKTKKASTVAIPVTSTGVTIKIGQYARSEFEKRMPTMSATMISNLTDISYCKKEFSLAFPLLVEVGVSSFDKVRYYAADYNIGGKTYRLCKEWYERHRAKIAAWFAANP